MKDLSTVPNIDSATGNRDRGVMRDDTTPGDGTGTPLREDYLQDIYYALRAVLNAAGNTPDESEEGVLASQFLDSLIQIAEPVGTIKDWDKTFPSTPSLPSWYVECDGTVISDSDSPFNGYRSRNLNGANVVLSVDWTADAGGAYGTVAATDITALAIGDQVSGSGIAANTFVTNVAGTTVTISDTAASGNISTTFTNDGRFLRGASASGVGQVDEFQGHNHDIYAAFWNASSSGGTEARLTTASAASVTNKDSVGNEFVRDEVDNGSDGTPRTGSETRPINTSVVKIMKIK